MNLVRGLLMAFIVLATASAGSAQVVTEDQFVVIPFRVHILSSPNLELANCKMSDAEAGRLMAHVNDIWHKAGIHFGVESIRRELVEQVDRFRVTTEARGEGADVADLQILLPRASRTFDGLQVYLFHDLPFNGGYVGDDVVFVQEGASVQKIAGGGDDAVARVTARAIGSALGLPDHSDPRNLMANGTSGVALIRSQAETAREVARTVRGATTAARLRTAVSLAEARNDQEFANRFRGWLAESTRAIEAIAAEGRVKAGAVPRQPDQLLVIPIRVHVLTASDLDLANCRLTDAGVAGVISHLNGIWHPAGIHLGVESVVREEAEQKERFRLATELSGGVDASDLRLLLPRSSRGGDLVHLYFFHELPFNSVCLGDDVIVAQENARVRTVKDGGDDPLARVTAHALGNLFGLTNEMEPRNLMAGGTSGIALDRDQAAKARKITQTIRGVTTVAEIRKAAVAAEARKDIAMARRLRSMLAGIPDSAPLDGNPPASARVPAER